MFPLLLTRALLPGLRRTAKSGPVLVQFVGSLAAENPPPRHATYAGSKSFLKALVRGLNNDERFWDGPSGVTFECLVTYIVQSNNMHLNPSWMAPRAETFAKAVVKRAGCGRWLYTPYMPHAILLWSAQLLGEKKVDELGAREIEAQLAAEEKWA